MAFVLFGLTVWPPAPATSARAQGNCYNWGVGWSVGLRAGAEIRTGSGLAYPVIGLVPVDDWPVEIIAGPRSRDGRQWWDIRWGAGSRSGSGWVMKEQAGFYACPPLPPPPRTPPRVPSAEPAPAADHPIVAFGGDNRYFLRIDLHDPRVQVRVGLANDDLGGYETLESIKDRLAGAGYPEWAVINGDYFSPVGCPLGVNCGQGLTYTDGAYRENWPAYGGTWQRRANLGFGWLGEIAIAIGNAQPYRREVIGGGPWLAWNGHPPVCRGQYSAATRRTRFTTGEQFDGNTTAWCTDTRAHTLAGHSADRRYLFLGVSGGGSTILQTARWLQQRGASDILKLDSGGSSGMYHNGHGVLPNNSRRIVNFLAVLLAPS